MKPAKPSSQPHRRRSRSLSSKAAVPDTLAQTLYKAGQAYLREVLSETTTMQEAACIAGVNRTDLYKVMRRYGIKPARTMKRGQWDRPIPEDW